MNNYNCIECNKHIYAIKFNNTTLYRCGDANVCSENCSKNRYIKLENIDPCLSSPFIWYKIPQTIKKTESMNSLHDHISLPINDKLLDTITEEKDQQNNHSTNILYNFYKFIFSSIFNIIFIITK